MTPAASRTYSSQKFGSRQIRQLTEGTTPEGPDKFAVKPDIPALTQSLPSSHDRVISTRDDQPRRGIKLPGPEGWVSVRPIDPTPFHKQ